jgi:hypothetical protein
MAVHSKLARSHDDNRRWVCAPCGVKLKQHDRILSDQNVNFIIQHINPNFERSNSKFPEGICNGCRAKFASFEKDPRCILPVMPNYDDIVIPR